jgi:hypothetical protein
MAWTDALGEVLNKYTAASGGAAAAPADPHQDYRNVAESSPPNVLADALAHSFRSDATPSFPEMVAGLFRHSNPDQKAGLLSQLLASIGPGALAKLPQLRELAGSGPDTPPVSSSQASQVSAEWSRLQRTRSRIALPSSIG